MPRFLALFMGSRDSVHQEKWNALAPEEQARRSAEAMQAWGQWAERNKSAIHDIGSPLGKTLLASPQGIAPTQNTIVAYVIVEAPSHDAAALTFKDHPHFSISPGTGVEILQCLPLPGVSARQ